MSLIAAQSDLFGEPALAGLSQADAIVTPGEEQELIASIDAVELRRSVSMDGWVSG